MFRGRIAVTVVALAWLAGGTFAAYAAAGVSVQGNKRVDSETIGGYFTGTDQASINKGVKDLYATGLFSDVRVSRVGDRVVITVTENNVINRVAFEGNSAVKTETLTTEVQSKSRGPYSKAMVDADIERIKDVYRRSGRAAASVTARTVDLPNGKLDVVFTIDEGGKTGIKAINFVGDQVYSPGKLRELMETTEMNYLSFFKTSDVYDPDKIASDLERIRRFYLKNGYADFHVVGSDAQFDPEQGGYIVTITVEEGVQYTVAAVNVDSHLPDIDGASLLPLVRLSPGEIYNGDMVEKSVDALTKEVGKHGYPFTQVRPRGDRDPATRTVTIAFVLEEGPRVYIERIDVRGNTRTRDYVIRREFEIGEGDAYNRVYMDRAERRLNNLGYFGDRNQFHGTRSICEAWGLRGAVQPRRQFQFHRTLFSWQPDRGGLRSLREAERSLAIFLLQQQYDRRCAAPWFACDGSTDVLAKIFALPHRHHHSQQFCPTLQRLYRPSLGNDTGIQWKRNRPEHLL